MSRISRALTTAAGGMVGEGADEGDVGLLEAVGRCAVDAERAQRVVPGDERRNHHRSEADPARDAVGRGDVLEPRICEVVAGDLGRPLA